MTPRRVACALAAAALALGGRPAWAQAPAPSPFAASFERYVSVGDGLAAGFVSNSLVETHQVNSVPALLARQAGAADFQQPLVSEPGLPPEFTLLRLSPVPLIAPKADAPGTLRNRGLGRPYNNLAVPGAIAADALTRTTDGGGFHDLILRGRGTQVAQAVSLRPSLVTLWIGTSDVLGAVLRGRTVEGVTITPAETFRTAYRQIVTALKGTGAPLVAADLPDPTTLPFATTIARVVTNPATGEPVLSNGQPVPLLGPEGPLPPGTLVTLAASSLLAAGNGIPAALGGRGTALPDEVVLDPAEVSFIRDRVSANNRAIREICQAEGVPVVDVNGFYRQASQEGFLVGGVRLSSAFLTGGIFSYDGVHPTDVGYALLANEWIEVLNANGADLPAVDLAPFLGFGVRAASGRSLSAAGELAAEAWHDLLLTFPTLDR